MTARFDELIHPATRLSITALLVGADWVEFGYIRDRLGLSDSALSKQLATLESAGYVTLERQLKGQRHRLLASLTPQGRAAFHAHVAALQQIITVGDGEPTVGGRGQGSNQ